MVGRGVFVEHPAEGPLEGNFRQNNASPLHLTFRPPNNNLEGQGGRQPVQGPAGGGLPVLEAAEECFGGLLLLGWGAVQGQLRHGGRSPGRSQEDAATAAATAARTERRVQDCRQRREGLRHGRRDPRAPQEGRDTLQEDGWGARWPDAEAEG